MQQFICIHGHFYQPPRENPWTERVESQAAAYPFHDWNERITAECYAPNSRARILDHAGKVSNLVNNYSRISFNFGPTLLSWLKDFSPAVYLSIIEADRAGMHRFSGHGPALSQAYNHLIMPLANSRDKRTQVCWGVSDFQHRFGRAPEGMWLPETAADLETLDYLAEAGIKFTILAPGQARRVLETGSQTWKEVPAGSIDISRPYIQNLPSGRSISVFFYDGGLSHDIAFGGLLHSGHSFAQKLQAVSARDGFPLAHVATDGETYGHHHRFGEMALAAALEEIDASADVRLTIYGEYLERHPATSLVEITENSSWSCSHGVERWRGNCGCSTGSLPHGRQAWRAPLRVAFDWLRDALAPVFETEGGEIFADPWTARDAYISMILDRSVENTDRFFAGQACSEPDSRTKVRALKLLEMQRCAMLMYTSCGWFFDDLSRIETTQVLRYAGRAVELARDLSGVDFETGFLRRLDDAIGTAATVTARTIYEKEIRDSRVDLIRAAAHGAIMAALDPRPGLSTFDPDNAFPVRLEASQHLRGGDLLLDGEATVQSTATGETAAFKLCLLALPPLEARAIVIESNEADSSPGALDAVVRAFLEGGAGPAIEATKKLRSGRQYTTESLFHDQRQKLLERAYIGEIEKSSDLWAVIDRLVLDPQLSSDAKGVWLSGQSNVLAEAFVNARLKWLLGGGHEAPLEEARELIDRARLAGLALDEAGLGYQMTRAIERRASAAWDFPSDWQRVRALVMDVEHALGTGLPVDLSEAQRVCFELLRKARSNKTFPSRDWVSVLATMTENLSLRIG